MAEILDEFSEDKFWALMDKLKREKARKLLEADQELVKLEILLGQLEKKLKEVHSENEDSSNYLNIALKDDIYSVQQRGVPIGKDMSDRFGDNKKTTAKIRVDKDEMKALIETM